MRSMKKPAEDKHLDITSKDFDQTEFIEYYRKHWDHYIEDYLGLKTWSGMRYICDKVQHNQRTSIRACHGVGKTITASAVAVTFLNLYFPSIVITTAPTGNQVRIYSGKKSGISIQKKNDS